MSNIDYLLIITRLTDSAREMLEAIVLTRGMNGRQTTALLRMLPKSGTITEFDFVRAYCRWEKNRWERAEDAKQHR